MILLQQVLRHEEFNEGCAAQCNGPYDNRWSKTMIGYGEESSHFVLELTYNYGKTSYKLGNEFGGIVIKSKEAIARAKSSNYPLEQNGNEVTMKAPDGYKFIIIDESIAPGEDPVKFIKYNVKSLESSIKYWGGLLNMAIVRQDSSSALLSYNDGKFGIQFNQIVEQIDRAEAFGRVAFAVPHDIQPVIDETIKKHEQTILTPLIKLDTPGKASVRVIILADPDANEICFVDEEGFSELSALDPKSDAELNKFIKKDPFQVWTETRRFSFEVALIFMIQNRVAIFSFKLKILYTQREAFQGRKS